MRRFLTLTGPGRTGELAWDDEAGAFEGTDADELAGSARYPVSRPGWLSCVGLPAHDPVALIILLHIWGWDVPPELAGDAAAFLAKWPPPSDGVVY